MKSLAIIFPFLILFSTSLASAQSKSSNNQTSQYSKSETPQTKSPDASTLDKLQKETEEVSLMKPILFIASIIEGRIDLHKSERESVDAAKAKEAEMR